MNTNENTEEPRPASPRAASENESQDDLSDAAHAEAELTEDDLLEAEEAEAEEASGASSRGGKPSASRGKKKPEAPAETSERLQKLLSRAGVASRRAAETLIAEGKVSVNGHIVKELGFKADPSRDKILVNNKPLQLSDAAPTVVLLHKPRGYVTTKSDPQGRATVLDLLPKKLQNLNPVGRLDFDTSGVLLLTDDGDLLHLLTHPSRGVEKLYHARVGGKVMPDTVKKLEEGIYILEDDKHVKTAPCRVTVRAQTENNSLVEIALREGRNRQVRKMLEAVGHRVSSLRRVRFADLELQELSAGAYRILLPGEVHALRKATEKSARKKQAFKAAIEAEPRKPRFPSRAGKPSATTSRPTTSRPSDARNSDSRGSDTRSSGTRSFDSRSSDTRGSDAFYTDAQIPEGRSYGQRKADSRGADARGSNSRGNTRRPASSSPDARRASSRNSDSRSGAPRSSENRSSTARSSDARPSDARGSRPRSSESRSSESRSSDSRNPNARGSSGSTGARGSGSGKPPKKPAPLGERIRREWKE